MEEGRTTRWVRRFIPIAVAVVGLMGASVPFTAALAQSKNRVNCYDVDPIYHMNLITNPTCEGYWNHGLVNPYYDPAHPYAGYGNGYPYYGYAHPYYPW